MMQLILFLTVLACAPFHNHGIQSPSLTTALSTASSRIQRPQPSTILDRRTAFTSIAIAGSSFLLPITYNNVANAAEDNQVLSDEEMAAKIARKMELLRSSKSSAGGTTAKATDVRSDVNPEAAVNLRSRSAVENAKIAMEKQKELKSRDNAQKREDLCEMLGRGC